VFVNTGRVRCLIAFVAVALSSQAKANTAQTIYAKYSDSVVTLRTYDEYLFPAEQGSGVIVKTSDDGSFILTNFHVIFRSGLILTERRTGERSAAKICSFDRESDTALLHIAQKVNCSTLAAAPKVQIGSEICVIGTPQDLGWTISNGIVSAVRESGLNNLIQFTAAVSPGSSGGPVFDAQSQLIGITAFKWKEGENLNFAIQVTPDSLRKFQNDCWEGSSPADISELEWCVGHSQAGFLWMEPVGKPKLWRTYDKRISELKKRHASVSNKLDKDGFAAAMKEAESANERGEQPRMEVNRLQYQVNQLYAERFKDFPDDAEAWTGAFEMVPKKDKANFMKLGLNKWPHDPEVLKEIMSYYLLDCGKVDQFLQIFLAVAKSLPSRSEVLALQSNDAAVDVDTGKAKLGDLVACLRFFINNEIAFSGNLPQGTLVAAGDEKLKPTKRLSDGSVIFENGIHAWPDHIERDLGGRRYAEYPGQRPIDITSTTKFHAGLTAGRKIITGKGW
jgi:hypothetical protein